MITFFGYVFFFIFKHVVPPRTITRIVTTMLVNCVFLYFSIRMVMGVISTVELWVFVFVNMSKQGVLFSMYEQAGDFLFEPKTVLFWVLFLNDIQVDCKLSMYVVRLFFLYAGLWQCAIDTVSKKKGAVDGLVPVFDLHDELLQTIYLLYHIPMLYADLMLDNDIIVFRILFMYMQLHHIQDKKRYPEKIVEQMQVMEIMGSLIYPLLEWRKTKEEDNAQKDNAQKVKFE